ncbi:MAG: hypothetical protein AB8B56_16325 [Crocinitomicaceae bacterium]
MDIVKEKEFSELSAAERAELGELCSSEEEFNQMKAMFASIGAISWSNPTPRAETKESLDHLFTQKHPKAAPIWYNAPLAVVAPKNKPFYRQPLIQAAAVGLLIFLAYPFVKSNMMTSETTQVAALEKENTSSEMKEVETQVDEDAQNSQEIEVKDGVEIGAENKTVILEKMESNEAEITVTRESNVLSPAPAAVTSARFLESTVTTDLAANGSTFKDASVGGAVAPGSDHPDGIFIGDKKEIFSVPASQEPAVFDLLTTTF